MDEMRKSVIDRAEDIINGQNQAMSLVAEQRNAYTKIFALYQMAGGLTEHFWQSLDKFWDACREGKAEIADKEAQHLTEHAGELSAMWLAISKIADAGK